MKSVVIVGTASNGPLGLYQPSSVDEVLELYGAYRWEVKTLTSTATGFTLSEPALGNVVEVFERDGLRYKPVYLWDLACSGDVVTFGPPGYLMDGKKIYVKYRRCLPDGDVVKAYEAAAQSGCRDIYVYRASGQYATGTVAGCAFRALNPGGCYNGTLLTIAPTGLTIGEVPGLYREQIVAGTTYEEIRSGVARLLTLGLSPVTFDTSRTGTISGTGTTYLTGGTDGELTITPGLLEEMCSQFEVVILPGVTASDLAETVTAEDIFEIEGSYPAFIVLDAPVPTDSVSGWLSGLCSDEALRSKLLMTAACTGLVNQGTVYEYSCGLAASLGGVIGLWGNPTAKPTGLVLYGPVLTADQLMQAASSGINVPTSTVMRPGCWWYGVVRDTSWRYEDVSSYIEIVRLVRSRLDPLIGRPGFDIRAMSDITDMFDACVESDVTEASLRVDGGTLTVEVTCRPIGTVHDISFSVLVAPRSTGVEILAEGPLAGT